MLSLAIFGNTMVVFCMMFFAIANSLGRDTSIDIAKKDTKKETSPAERKQVEEENAEERRRKYNDWKNHKGTAYDPVDYDRSTGDWNTPPNKGEGTCPYTPQRD